MKGGFCGLKGTEISLISIVLMSATIIILSWVKTPGLTAFLPPSQTQLQLSSGEDGSSLPKKKTKNEQEEVQLNVASQIVSAQSSSGRSTGESNSGTTLYREQILSSVSDEEAKKKIVLEDGNYDGVQTLSSRTKTDGESHQAEGEASKQEENRRYLEDPMHSQQRSSLVSGNDKTNQNNVSENKEILSSVSDVEAKQKKVVEDGNHDDVQTLSSRTKADGKSHQEENGKYLEAPTYSQQRSSLISGNDKTNQNNVLENKAACNYAKGKWVPDNNRPLYSGFGCKQWLSGMWACRLTQRTDFAYEKLRWQPKNCQMEEFSGSKFLRRMQNKTLAFVGDSLGRQQFQSLMCMITGGKETNDVEDVGNEYGLAVAEGAARPNGWAYRFSSTNTTILYYWSAILCDVEPIDVNNTNTDYAMHLDRPLAFLRQYLHKFDVLVLNTGHHWNRGKLKANRWVMHVGGVPNTDRKIEVIWGAKNLTIHSVVSWVHAQLPKYPSLKVFFRTISPRHFVGGDWNTGGSCDNTTPMSVGKEILEEESSDQVAANAVKGTRVKLLDITALSQLRDEGHISRFSITAKSGVQDCLHWCLPGVPDTWNEILFAQI